MKDLINKRQDIEREIQDILRRLNAESGVGEGGSLLDKQGFPRADVDLVKIRQDRNKLASLYSDHKQLSLRIEKGLHDLHASTRQKEVRPRVNPANTSVEQADRPFALVDEVSTSSPAAQDGLQIGDQILQFGSLSIKDVGSSLRKVAEYAGDHENSKVLVKAVRAGKLVQVELMPRRWEGNGLIGCHMKIL